MVEVKGSSPAIQGEKRYALLMAARDSDYVKKAHGGYFNVFLAAFGDEQGERWDSFMVVDGEFPDAKDLHCYDGFVVSGSPCDAYGNDEWILELCLLLQTLHSLKKKVLGICFGHQVFRLCAGHWEGVGKATTGWDIGLRRVNIAEDLVLPPPCPVSSFLEDLGRMSPPSLSIIECHQDEVYEVPSEAKVIAFSDKTGVEMFAIGDHILGIQGHPEYTKDIVCSIIDRLLDDCCIEREFAEKAKSGLESAEPDRSRWEKICRNFLKER